MAAVWNHRSGAGLHVEIDGEHVRVEGLESLSSTEREHLVEDLDAVYADMMETGGVVTGSRQ